MPQLPQALQESIDPRLQQWQELQATDKAVPAGEWQAVQQNVWAGSEFVARLCLRSPELLTDLHESGDLYRTYNIDEFKTTLAASLYGLDSELAVKQQLRRVRQREMLRIAWRDLAGWSRLDEVMQMEPIWYRKHSGVIEKKGKDKGKMKFKHEDDPPLFRVGFSAQKMEKIIPEAVTAPSDAEGVYALEYNSIIPVAVRAIQELKEQVDQQQAIIDELVALVNL